MIWFYFSLLEKTGEEATVNLSLSEGKLTKDVMEAKSVFLEHSEKFTPEKAILTAKKLETLAPPGATAKFI